MAGLKVSTLYNAIQAEAAPVKAMPVPDLTSADTTPDILHDYIVRSNQAKYKEAKLANDLTAAMNSFSDDELKAFYNRCKGPKVHSRFTEAEFIRRIRKGDMTNGFSHTLWGHADNAPVFAAFDELFADKQEILEKIQTGLAGNAPLPDTPEFTGKKEAEPYKQYVEDARKELADPNDPEKTSRTNAVLDEAAECLKVVDPEVREYFDRYDHSEMQYAGPGIQVAQELMKGVMVNEGLKTLGGGKYTGYLEPKNMHGGIQYIADDSNYWSKTRAFTEQAQNELGEEDLALSDNTVDTVVNMTNVMDTLTHTHYVGKQKEHRFKLSADPEAPFFLGENGTKYYTFWPLIDAKNELLDAVKSKDIDKISAGVEKYKQVDARIQTATPETSIRRVKTALICLPNM